MKEEKMIRFMKKKKRRNREIKFQRKESNDHGM